MRQQTLKIGRVEITAAVDVDVVDEPMVAAFPGAPPDALLEEKTRYPGVYGADDRWRLRVRAWLVRHPGGLLLMDTGVGGPWSLTQAWCSSPGALVDVLREQGVQPGDVDTVALSHVHDDHIGGTADANGEPMFANARYLLQRADRDWQRDLAREDEDDREFWDAFLSFGVSGPRTARSCGIPSRRDARPAHRNETCEPTGYVSRAVPCDRVGAVLPICRPPDASFPWSRSWWR